MAVIKCLKSRGYKPETTPVVDVQHGIIPMDKTEYFGLVIGAHLSIDVVATSHFALKHTVSLTYSHICLTAAISITLFQCDTPKLA